MTRHEYKQKTEHGSTAHLKFDKAVISFVHFRFSSTAVWYIIMKGTRWNLEKKPAVWAPAGNEDVCKDLCQGTQCVSVLHYSRSSDCIPIALYRSYARHDEAECYQLHRLPSPAWDEADEASGEGFETIRSRVPNAAEEIKDQRRLALNCRCMVSSKNYSARQTENSGKSKSQIPCSNLHMPL